MMELQDAVINLQSQIVSGRVLGNRQCDHSTCCMLHKLFERALLFCGWRRRAPAPGIVEPQPVMPAPSCMCLSDSVSASRMSNDKIRAAGGGGPQPGAVRSAAGRRRRNQSVVWDCTSFANVFTELTDHLPQVDASPSPAPCVPLPGVGGATPSNASLPVRQLQFASAARCAGARAALAFFDAWLVS